ncbi:MAG: heme ABC exporter ATP-binding protein CcmA [Anaerolineales bacterium]|nr:heme ABC exporter ATP-binding protein CcmA [Anaerolineales bacterium]
MITLKGLTKTYGLNPVLRGVNLQIKAGEFVALVGSNGAGKTTLLRIVATLLKPTAGEISVGGWPLPQHADRVRRHIGLVSHQPMVYGDLTAEENLRFYAQLYGLQTAEHTLRDALKTVGLGARQNDFVRTFSRGMFQRLTIARATLHNPDVLLLDEPYTGLDQAAAALLDELLGEQSARGRTIFMITHDLVHGLNICDRIAILNRGKIVHEVPRGEMSAGEFLDFYKAQTSGRGKGQHG